ncbi:MAG: N-acetylneuraminate synthase [Candidatus Wallbacteria bacterium HGW-Wallbacteria-1]|jgi:N-acetylneuraminate synthase/N,N'-diacetyllegionaminate synthase|uniref:N-acetylneuraminate synthase n=1 Tax=Candidatus Wallbacteria bacterium HGW-Wallbacteria-1 TaxID=2013854 RepID=A0A2N1PL14_9BACT|nr:MAG: N-acetylneuraminate synthase [Candidatus Wallbacteria bacterium HGW-Wallbacteria-1]
MTELVDVRSAISISGRMIGSGFPVLVVAELGINHNGSVDRALEMIEAAAAAGVDAVKFQTFSADEFMSSADQTYTYLSQGQEITESMHSMFKRYELGAGDFQKMFRRAEQLGLIAFSTPTDMSCARLLLPFGLPAVKVGSDDLVNTPLIEELSGLGLPVMLSTGMADMHEVKLAYEAACLGFQRGTFSMSSSLSYGGAPPVALMVCTSLYPTEDQDANVARVATFAREFPKAVVGFSDHTRDSLAACAAVALGASIVEKHFTLDRNLPGPDHWFSCDPMELENLVANIERTHRILGTGIPGPTQGEIEMRHIARRSLCAARNISAGTCITRDDLAFQRPGTGLPPSKWQDVAGCIAKEDIPAGAVICPEHLGEPPTGASGASGACGANNSVGTGTVGNGGTDGSNGSAGNDADSAKEMGEKL